ncbi:MAG TPA: ABC transporter ATP-binding protein [Nevskiaceae bacterium]|nr:ABC transporter ATP-binding protein [Nevskiaceae bacterium]
MRDLNLRFATPEGEVHALRGVDLDVAVGETLGIVGESGSGKSQLLISIISLLAKNSSASGSIRFHDQELLHAPERSLRPLRGRRIAMVFQDPMTSLNPHLTVARQLTEGLRLHLKLSRRAALDRARELLQAVHLADAPRRLHQYPHELSGGMRQRVAIAMALACEPDLLLADEPTTALDVTVQAQILALLRELHDRFNTTVILVTHDLGVVAQIADRIAVMYAGRIVEHGPLAAVFKQPHHPYTEALRHASPRLDADAQAGLAAIPGQPPDLATRITGCAFAPRCAYRMARCTQEAPPTREVSAGHSVACFYEQPLSGRTPADTADH